MLVERRMVLSRIIYHRACNDVYLLKSAVGFYTSLSTTHISGLFTQLFNQLHTRFWGKHIIVVDYYTQTQTYWVMAITVISRGLNKVDDFLFEYPGQGRKFNLFSDFLIWNTKGSLFCLLLTIFCANTNIHIPLPLLVHPLFVISPLILSPTQPLCFKR